MSAEEIPLREQMTTCEDPMATSEFKEYLLKGLLKKICDAQGSSPNMCDQSQWAPRSTPTSTAWDYSKFAPISWTPAEKLKAKLSKRPM